MKKKNLKANRNVRRWKKHHSCEVFGVERSKSSGVAGWGWGGGHPVNSAELCFKVKQQK